MLALLGNVCEVAVLPPIVYPSIYAFLPDPSDTTVSRIVRTVSEVSSEIILFLVSYFKVFTRFPSIIHHLDTKMRGYSGPAVNQ